MNPGVGHERGTARTREVPGRPTPRDDGEPETLRLGPVSRLPPEEPSDDGSTCGRWNRLGGSDLLVQETTLWQVENDLSGTVLERRIVRWATLSLAAAPGVGQ